MNNTYTQLLIHLKWSILGLAFLLYSELSLAQSHAGSSGPTISNPREPAPKYAEAVNQILDNVRLGLTHRCMKNINNEAERLISSAQGRVEKKTKFNLVVDYKSCTAALNEYKPGTYLLSDDSRMATIEILPLSEILGQGGGDDYYIVPKINGKLTSAFFKLEGVTLEMWKTIKKDTLQTMLFEKYETKEYVSAKLRRGRCGYLYSKTNKSGNLKVYLSGVHESYKEAKKNSEDKNSRGYNILDVACNL